MTHVVTCFLCRYLLLDLSIRPFGISPNHWDRDACFTFSLASRTSDFEGRWPDVAGVAGEAGDPSLLAPFWALFHCMLIKRAPSFML